MRRGFALAWLVVAIGCGAFGSDESTQVSPTSDGGAPVEAAAPDGGASPDGGTGWCATNHPGAVCDDFDGNWVALDRGWDARGPLEIVARAGTDKALRVRVDQATNPITKVQFALYRTFSAGKTHVKYSFDFRAVTMTPPAGTDYWAVPASLVLFAQGSRSTLDVERAPTEWNLRVTGYNGQPKNILGGAGFPQNDWTRVVVEAKSVSGGNDTFEARYGAIPTPTSVPTTFAVKEDMTLMLGVELGTAGTVEYLFDNFLVEALE